ncbi:MAG: hypothetical protein FWB94_02275 [Chitinispirillia bacterium]|nr:hypothetical protein [Chitinispirillia bacterium]
MHIDTRWYTDTIAANPEAAEFAISTAEELAGLAAIVNGDAEGIERDSFDGKAIRLTADIDLSVCDNWTAIGRYRFDRSDPGNNIEMPFSGSFDGGGYVIRNLTINRPDESHLGLFGHIEYGSVKNLGLENVNIRGDACVGAVAGCIHYSDGGIAECRSAGTVSGAGNCTVKESTHRGKRLYSAELMEIKKLRGMLEGAGKTPYSLPSPSFQSYTDNIHKLEQKVNQMSDCTNPATINKIL